MVVSEIRLYEMLKAKIGEKEAEAFVDILEKKVEAKFDDKKNILATKEDLASLETKILRNMYLTSLGQLLAIVASVIGLLLTINK